MTFRLPPTHTSLSGEGEILLPPHRQLLRLSPCLIKRHSVNNIGSTTLERIAFSILTVLHRPGLISASSQDSAFGCLVVRFAAKILWNLTRSVILFRLKLGGNRLANCRPVGGHCGSVPELL